MSVSSHHQLYEHSIQKPNWEESIQNLLHLHNQIHLSNCIWNDNLISM